MADIKKFLDLTGLTYLVGKLQAQINGKADADHTHTPADIGAAEADHDHAAEDITSGTMSADRLPVASESAAGIVTAAAQNIAGAKTFRAQIAATAGLKTSGAIVPSTAGTQSVGNNAYPFKNMYSKDLAIVADGTGTVYGQLSIPTVGTASAVGVSRMILGNGTASGTANNAQGEMRVYGQGANYHTIKGNPTGNRTLTLPDATGTLALKSDIPDAAADIGAAPSDIITAGTTDLTAGTSALASGKFYAVY